jgi:uncharacterized protein YbjT (DUF2867 family)
MGTSVFHSIHRTPFWTLARAKVRVNRAEVTQGGRQMLRLGKRFIGLLAGFAAMAVLLAVPAEARAAAAPDAGSKHDVGAILVFGGSGQLGSEIVKQLLAAGYPVSVFIRPTSDRSRLAGLKVKLIEGNVLNEPDVERALKSQPFDVVINALGRSESGVDFYATSGRLIALWCKATGVKQVILHSSVGVGESRAAYPPGMFPQRSELFVNKQVAEDDLITSGITYTIIRNAVLHELAPGASDGARLYEDQTKFGAVSRRGLARLTRECVGNAACANRIYHAVDAGMPL